MHQTRRPARPKGTKRQHPKYSKSIGHEKKGTGKMTAPRDEPLGLDSDNEGSSGYKKGGYHPVYIGERYKDGRYVVLQKLGWGHFSTVWLVHDQKNNRQLAMKVQKSASQYTDAARDEIDLLSDISRGDPYNEKCCCVLYDWFEHRGPHGTHICMVFETLGDNLLKLVKQYDYKGIPIPIVKNITRQILVGLDYLHRECNIIHTDLKLENVMLTKPLTPRPIVDVASVMQCTQPRFATPNGKLSKNQKRRRKAKLKKQALLSSSSLSTENESGEQKSEVLWCESPRLGSQRPLSEEDLTEVGCKIVDFGNACWTHKHFSKDIQTRQYRCPEVILGASYGTSADMWSMACTVFELITGDFLFDPKATDYYDRDEDHLALFIELLGRMPERVALHGEYARKYFNHRGELRNVKNLCYCSLERAFRHRYKFSYREAEEMASFLLPMLEFDPGRRATARQMLNHPWLRLHDCRMRRPLSLTPRDSSVAMKRMSSYFSSDLDSSGHDSWMEESDDREFKCPSRIESWNCVDEDCVTRMSPTSLEGIAEMQQIFHKMSLSHDGCPRNYTSLISSSELNSSDTKLYKVHDSVGSVHDA